MKKFTDITDLKECFEITGLPDAQTINEIPEEFHEEMLADYRTKVMAKCANTLSQPGKSVEMSDLTQKKHFPWFIMDTAGGLAFYVTNCHYSNACAGDASRRAFLEGPDARHAGITWPDIFNTSLRK